MASILDDESQILCSREFDCLRDLTGSFDSDSVNWYIAL